MKQERKKETSFLRAFRLHRSGIRFLGAGLYCDAIHTLIHGLDVLEFSIEEHDSHNDVSVKFARWKQAPSLGRTADPKIEVSKTPMDHTCYTNEEWMTPMLKPCCNRCRGSLVGAMLYNMALAFHLQAITFEQGNELYEYLNQASSLYCTAEGILQKHNVTIWPNLETNERHIHWVICSRPVPDSALLNLQPRNNMEADFGSIITQTKDTDMETTMCSWTQSYGVEADFAN